MKPSAPPSPTTTTTTNTETSSTEQTPLLVFLRSSSNSSMSSLPSPSSSWWQWLGRFQRGRRQYQRPSGECSEGCGNGSDHKHKNNNSPTFHDNNDNDNDNDVVTVNSIRRPHGGRSSLKSDATASSFSSASQMGRDDEDGDNDDDIIFPVSRATYIYAMCAALNSVNLGYDLGVSTNVGPMVRQAFDLSIGELELFLGSLNFWSIFGALLSPLLSDRWGRRTTLRVAALGFVLGVVVMSTAPNFGLLMVGRTIVGLGVGLGEAIDPMYIAEIAPAHVRGELVSWAEAGVAIGVVLGFASSLLGVEWRCMLALGAVLPCAMMYLATFVLPESPRWLVAKEQTAAARRILQTIYPAHRVDGVITEIADSLALERAASHVVGWEFLFHPSPAIGRMLLVGIGIAIIQQAVGIDSIMFYLMFVLQNSGIKTDLGQDLSLIALGTVKLLFVFVGGRLLDCFGRRPLLFVSLLGMAASCVVVSFTFTSQTASMKVLTIAALAAYLAFFSVGLGPGNWVVVSEVFATSIRAKAMMLAVLPNRITSTIMASTFLTVARALTWPGFFLLLAGICLASFLFLFVYLPETKGKSLEDMARFFAEIMGDRTILDVEERIRRERMEEQQQQQQQQQQQNVNHHHHHHPSEVELGLPESIRSRYTDDSSSLGLDDKNNKDNDKESTDDDDDEVAKPKGTLT